MIFLPGVRRCCLILVSIFLCLGPVFAKANGVLPRLIIEKDKPLRLDASPPCRYTGDFVQERTLPDQANTVKSSGKFLFSCNRGLLWEVYSPIVDTRVYASAKSKFRIPKNGRVAILRGVIELRTAKLMLSFLGGNTQSLEKDFVITTSVDDERTLELVPKSNSVKKRLDKILIRQNDQSVAVVIRGTSTGNVDITITNIELYDDGEMAACRRFSRRPRLSCPVFVNPEEFAARLSEKTR